MIDAVNGIGHAAVMCDPQFRQVLADRGFTVDAETGEVNELAGFAGAFSARARQIGQNIARYEAAWRDTHPGQDGWSSSKVPPGRGRPPPWPAPHQLSPRQRTA